MNKKNSMAKLGVAVLLFSTAHLAQAQEVAVNGALKLPDDVRQVFSIDAHNILLVETADPDDATESEYSSLSVLHVYGGGIARLFGGTVIPTEMLISPAFSSGGFGGGSFGGGNRNGIPSVSGFNSGGFNNGGLGQTLNQLDHAPQQVAIGQ